jgi:hypothetical protein
MTTTKIPTIAALWSRYQELTKSEVNSESLSIHSYIRNVLYQMLANRVAGERQPLCIAQTPRMEFIPLNG